MKVCYEFPSEILKKDSNKLLVEFQNKLLAKPQNGFLKEILKKPPRNCRWKLKRGI